MINLMLMINQVLAMLNAKILSRSAL